MPYKDPEKQKEYQRRYKPAYMREYRRKRSDFFKKYYNKNCPNCGEKLS
jgi:hypothetical protein